MLLRAILDVPFLEVEYDGNHKQYSDFLRDHYSSKIEVKDYSIIRLDWELSDQLIEELIKEGVYSEEYIWSLMRQTLAVDIDYLLIFGDTNSNDPLLKVLDGEKKRGTVAEDLHILEPIILKQPVPKKESTEYTVYLGIKPIWRNK